MPGDSPGYDISWCLEIALITILVFFKFYVRKKNFYLFRNVSYLDLGPTLCAFFVCWLRPPSPWSQTAANCSQFVPIISIYLRHKQSCGKPQKLALLAQLTSTLLHLIPSYHIAHPSPCRYRYVEPLTRLQDASNTATLSLRYLSMKVFSVDKKNQLDVNFCILYFSSSSCSTCFGQPCAHHQELTTA